MKRILFVVALLVLADSASAERFGRRRSTGNNTYNYSYSNGTQANRSYDGGQRYADCWDYVCRVEGGNYGSVVGVAGRNTTLQAGDVVHTGSHWMRIESVNGNTATISHSNVNGYHGRVVENRSVGSLNGTTVYRN